MRFAVTVVATTSLMALAAPALAAETASEELAASTAAVSADAGEREAAIVVKGERSSYGTSHTSTATKTDTPIKDIPQALTVISEAQVEDQQLRSVADLLYFVPGATPGTGEGNRDQITLRGNNTTADFFIDGIRDDVQYFRDFYNFDRIEVLKGPNAMIFGRGGGGGIVNRVTKRSHLNTSRQAMRGRRQLRRRAPDRRRRPAAGRQRRPARQRHVREWRQLPPPCRPGALWHQPDPRHPRRRRYAHRPHLRIFARPPHHRPRRAVLVGRQSATIDEPLEGSTGPSSATPTRAMPRPTCTSRRWRSSIASAKPDAAQPHPRSATMTNSTRTSSERRRRDGAGRRSRAVAPIMTRPAARICSARPT